MSKYLNCYILQDGKRSFIFRENADMRFDTNNAERLRITSGGNVHINGTPPWM